MRLRHEIPSGLVVWAQKYRRWIVREDIRRRLAQVFRDIAEDFGLELVELEEESQVACLMIWRLSR